MVGSLPLNGDLGESAEFPGRRPPQSTDAQPRGETAPRISCFVISPIGAEGSPTRKHMDDVYYCLIKPACDRMNIDVYRGDHKARPGRITNQIIRSILDDNLIICVLTGANPNVYYELAIAECAGRLKVGISSV